MSAYEKFKAECHDEVVAQGNDHELGEASRNWMNQANAHKYSYHFEWLGRPIIQYPQDVIAMQEIIWRVQPDLIIETGIAHGGSLIFSASMLELNSACGGPADAEVVGIDIEIRQHNREAIETHPMSKRITMLEGSSIAPETVSRVKELAAGRKNILVCLDSNHTHSHVLDELIAYAPLTTTGSYCIVFDTVINDMPEDMFPDRPWGPDDNPKTAVMAFLEGNHDFEIDKMIDYKLLVTVAPDGFLRRIK